MPEFEIEYERPDKSRYWQYVTVKNVKEAKKKSKNVPKFSDGDRIIAIRRNCSGV